MEGRGERGYILGVVGESDGCFRRWRADAALFEIGA